MIPSSSYAKLLIYFLLTVAACFGLAGILPLILLTFGVGMTIYSRQVAHLVTASKMIGMVYLFIAVIFVVVSVWHLGALRFEWMRVSNRGEHFGFSLVFFIFSGLAVGAAIFTQFMLRDAFAPYSDAIARNGFWGASRNTDPALDVPKCAAQCAGFKPLPYPASS